MRAGRRELEVLGREGNCIAVLGLTQISSSGMFLTGLPEHGEGKFVAIFVVKERFAEVAA